MRHRHNQGDDPIVLMRPFLPMTGCLTYPGKLSAAVLPVA